MILVMLSKLLAAVVCVGLGAGILARDHGLKANRLIAAFLFCNAWWACCEFFLYQAPDAETATRLFRSMSLGWIPLGVLCAHASVALTAMEDHPVSRAIPLCYVGLALILPVASISDWVIRDAAPTAYGWRAFFGPGMVPAYGLMVVPLLTVLASWRGLVLLADRGGRAQLSRVIFFGISVALVMGTMTAIVMPSLGIEVIGVTTLLVSIVGLASAWTLRCYGHSLISPEAFAREILDTLEDGVILVGDGGVLRDANRAFLRTVGDREASALGRPVTHWIPEFAAAHGPGTAPRLLEVVTRGGDRVPIVLSAPVACWGGGRRVGQVFLLRDRREIVSLQRQLIVSARLAAVGDLSKAISASINEPVATARNEFEGLALDWQTTESVLELAGLASESREAVEEGRELLEECVEGVERVFSIVREVAGFSDENERETFAPHPLDLIVRRAVRVARVQAPHGIEIEMKLDPDVVVLCHFAELERVVTNLLVNGLQALEGRAADTGHLVVAVAAQDGRALLHVEDDGCGIAVESLERIFDPFFTTKPVGKGTGLGLAISYHIIKSHGGEIRVSSVPDRGTSVAVELPRAPLQHEG